MNERDDPYFSRFSYIRRFFFFVSSGLLFSFFFLSFFLLYRSTGIILFNDERVSAPHVYIMRGAK